MTVSAPRPKLSTPVRPRPSARARWAAIAMILLCQVLAIGFVEFVLWCAGMGEEEIFHFDPQIGFVHMHDKRITWRTEGFAQSYLNHDGMREANLTVAKPANTYRVAVLGDSIVEGLQVPIEQTFGQIIARRLTPLSGKKIEFLNFGTSGYSTVQEYLLLKRSAMKYHPDLVLVCYNSRDLFENWTAPDQVITNVRPVALHLPGGHLVIDYLPVRRWLRSPRGQFMLSTNWLRAHSRICGLLAALDLELSQHNRFYRAIVDAVSHPKKVIPDLQEAIASLASNGPSFRINFFEDSAAKSSQASAVPATATEAASQHVLNSAAGNDSFEKTPALATATTSQHVFNSATGNDSFTKTPALAAVSAADNRKRKGAHHDVYSDLVSRTLASLFDEMRATCAAGNCDFAVIGLPVRAQLCPLPGSETEFNGIDYHDELCMLQSICEAAHIPYCDVENEAEKLPLESRPKLFYAVHLTPEGQQFIADVVQPFVRKLLTERQERAANGARSTAG